MDNTTNNTNYLQEGTTLTGRYVIKSVLGAGGFGITYKAWDELLDCFVAIKEYYPAGLVVRQDGATVSVGTKAYMEEFTKGKQRFLHEAKGLVKLKESKYVVNVQNFFEENQTAYMAMEFLEGDTLAQYYKKTGGKLTADEALPIIEKVLIALSEIHNQKLIHRDISPENIFVLPDGKVKLIDFGAAKQSYCGETQNISVILKPGYAPPEQYANSSPQGPWTDIYAVGATMYRMLTGKKPLESLSRILSDSLVSPASLENSIPAYLNNAIMKAMEIKPDNRFQNALDFKAAIFDEEKWDNTPVKVSAKDMGEAFSDDDYLDKTVPYVEQAEGMNDDYLDKTMPYVEQPEGAESEDDYLDKTMPYVEQPESTENEDDLDKTAPYMEQAEDIDADDEKTIPLMKEHKEEEKQPDKKDKKAKKEAKEKVEEIKEDVKKETKEEVKVDAKAETKKKNRLGKYFFVQRIAALVLLEIMFIPSLNPVRISSIIDKEEAMSLFMSALFRSKLSWRAHAYNQYDAYAIIIVLYVGALLMVLGILAQTIGVVVSIGGNKWKRRGIYFSLGGVISVASGLVITYVCYLQLGKFLKNSVMWKTLLPNCFWIYVGIEAVTLIATIIALIKVPKVKKLT